MRVLRACSHASWLPAASLLMIGTAARASEAIHLPAPPANAAHLSHGRFKDLLVYRPAGAPTSFVLFLSGDEGWNSSADAMARQLVQQGAMVAAIDWAQFKANLEADGDECVFPDGDLENLSHFVQAYFHVPTYLTPMLVGVSSGAAMAYAVLAQAPQQHICGRTDAWASVPLSICRSRCARAPGSNSPAPPAVGAWIYCRSKRLGNPWVDLHGDSDRSCPAGAARSLRIPGSRRGHRARCRK